MKHTRLIVKNLPDAATEPKLRELFGSKGTITDVQLKRFDDGKFRHFAFIGFKTEEEASNARDYFDKSFFGATKMQVEICHGLNDPNRPKAWSKHTKEKYLKDKKKHKHEEQQDEEDPSDSPPKKKKMQRKEEELLQKAQTDPDFLEFLQVHNTKNHTKWGNDTVLDTLEKLATKTTSENKKDIDKKVVEKTEKVDSKHYEFDDDGDEDDSDENNDESPKEDKPKGEKFQATKAPKTIPDDTFFTLKVRNLSKKTKKKDLKAFFAPLVPKSIRTPPSLRGFAYIGFLTEMEQKKALSKNRSMLLGNQISVKIYTSRSTVENNVTQKSDRWATQRIELDQVAEPVEESGRIFVRNLAYSVTEAELKTEFEQFGPVTEVHLPIDRITRLSKGFAFVSFLLPEHASAAFQSLDGSTFQGRMLHLLPSKGKDESESDTHNAGSSYKREKEIKQKKMANSSHNWNALFLGQNAVSAVTSEKYGVSREQLLLDNTDTKDDRVSSVAVRMALAETGIVSATQTFLEANGVCLEAFDSANICLQRSTTTMLVKNLVANTTEDELKELFEKHGVVGRVVLPPSGVTAIVEFMVPSEARGAFKKLAYTRYKSMPLYLEWAPVDVFRIASDGSKISMKRKDDTPAEYKRPSPPAPHLKKGLDDFSLPTYDEDDEPFDENMIPEPETTVFVKNLNFSSGDGDLKKHFSAMGRIFAVTVAKKKDPKNVGQMLSQGFGFVQYYRAKDAAKALSTLNQSMLQNHTLEVKMSSRTLQSEIAVEGKVGEEKKNGSKILVRNVPFQASEEEITDLFKVFGKLKAVRMPRKTMGESQHRGFAFIDYFVEANAKTAFDTLSKSTHIYGRRLVLEWAQKDATVEELRDKVSKQYSLRSSSSSSLGQPNSTKKQLKRYFEVSSTKGGAKEEDGDEDDD